MGKAEQTKVHPHKLAVGDEEEARGLGSFRRQARLEEQRRSEDRAKERPLDLKTNNSFRKFSEFNFRIS